MTTPPIPPGRQGQGPYGPPPGYGAPGRPPQKGGVPVWAWVVSAIVAMLLVCAFGGLGVYVATSGDDSSSTASGDRSDGDQTAEPTGSPSTSTLPTASPSVPPTPAGSTKNTESRFTISADDLEREISKRSGYSLSEISCPSDLVYIENRSTTCTAPARSGSATSSVSVTVAWAAKTSPTRVRAYLTFRQVR